MTAPATTEALPVPFRWDPGSGDSPVRVQGALPAWLEGQLVRTAPAVFNRPGWSADHWFDGLCLLYGFRLEGGQARFTQQLLGSQVEADSRIGKRERISFATWVRRPWWKRLFKPIADSTDNANVNVVPWRDGWLAMTEAPHQHLIDAATLVTRGVVKPSSLDDFNSLTAHPFYDAATRTMVNVGAKYDRISELRVFREQEDGTRVVEARVPLAAPPYIHGFGCSPHFVVVVDQPLRVTPIKMLFSNRPISAAYSWQPERGSRLLAIDRRTGTSRSWATQTLFVFHVVNQFEEADGTVVIDVLEYPDTAIIERLYMARLTARNPELGAAYVRYRLEPARKDAVREVLSDARFELPTVGRRGGLSYRYAWGVWGADGDVTHSTLVKVDLQTREVKRLDDAEWLHGEPVFVGRPGATEDDDGVLLAVGTAPGGGKSALSVVDAATMKRVALLEVDVTLPLGFHGNFQPRS